MAQPRPATAAARPARDLALPPGAAAYHLVTAIVATSGLVLQLVLTATAPGQSLPVRLLRLVSHFTVQADVLAALTCWMLWVRPTRGVRTVFRVARLDAVVGVTVTGLVYLVVLRPVVDLEGWWALADTLLHYAVPLLVVAGWVVYGPRRRVDRRIVLFSLLWPVGFFVWTVVHGAVSGFYPYPFVDVDEIGYGSVLGRAAVICALLLALASILLWVDRRLDARARRPRWIS